MTGVIEADHYREARNRLKRDPILRQMAREVPPASRITLTHEDGGPRMFFCSRAWEEYKVRGGKLEGHIGAAAEACIMVWEEAGWKRTPPPSTP